LAIDGPLKDGPLAQAMPPAKSAVVRKIPLACNFQCVREIMLALLLGLLFGRHGLS
jgi:hypothetical protein